MDIDDSFVAAFENKLLIMTKEETSQLSLVFSEPAPAAFDIIVNYDSEGLTYGTDFSILPNPNHQNIILSVKKGATSASIDVSRLLDKNAMLIGSDASIIFTITKVTVENSKIQGNSQAIISFVPRASLGKTITPDVGGPNEPNQVYIDLSTESEVAVKRTDWDLAFYNRDEYAVMLNSSIFMYAAKTTTTDIGSISNTSLGNLPGAMNFLVDNSNQYTDNPNGAMSDFVIKVAENIDDAPVYILKMGYKVGTETPEAGSAAIIGEKRGWMKIKIAKSGESYKIIYAPIDEISNTITPPIEKEITKKSHIGFTYYSLEQNQYLDVLSTITWDICFTTKTEWQQQEGIPTTYGFSDYVNINPYDGVKAYMIKESVEGISFDDFGKSSIDDTKFSSSQQIIGAQWRNVFSRSTYSDRFFILKDVDGNYYKIKFEAMVNQNQERGYPKFVYKLIE